MIRFPDDGAIDGRAYAAERERMMQAEHGAVSRGALPITVRGTIGLFCGSGALGILPLAVSPLLVTAGIQDLSLSPAYAALLSSIALFGVACGTLAMSPIADRLPPRRTASLGGITVVAAAILAHLGEHYWHHAVIWFAIGIGAGMASASTGSLIAQSVNPSRQAALVAVVTSLFLFAFIGSTSLLAEQIGYEGIAMSVLVTALLLLPGTWLLPRRAPEGARFASDFGIGLLSNPLAAILLIASVFFYSVKDASLWSMADVLGIATGLGPSQMGLILGLSGITGIIGAAIAVFATRNGLSNSLPVWGLIVTALLGIAASQLTQAMAFSIFMVAYTGAHLFMSPLFMGMAAMFDSSGRLVVATGAAVLIGSAVGPALGGFAMDWGNRPALGVAIACTAVLAAILYFASRRAWQRDEASMVGIRPLASKAIAPSNR